MSESISVSSSKNLLPDPDLKEDLKIFKFYQGLFFTDEEIKNSLYQQVMSIFRPKRFPVFQDDQWMQFVPLTQLEKIIYRNLKKHKPNEMTQEKFDKLPSLFTGTDSIKFKRG